MAESIKAPTSNDIKEKFRKCWIASTADSNLTLHGFRRFKTAHLLNLRFLENEIADMDHVVYQAGFSLGESPSSTDRLGLRDGKKNTDIPNIEDTVTQDFILRLRHLFQQYDEALASFHNIMAMETFSLFDDEQQSSLRDDLNLNEVYKTRLLRVDLGTRSRTDPFQRWLHRYLRAFRYWRLAGKLQNHNEESIAGRRHRWSYQNTVLVADIMGRITTVALMVAFLIAPLVILSRQSSKDTQLVVVSICIFTLSSLVSFFLKVSSFEMMAISAAYTAVLTVFISNNAEKAL